MRKDLKREDLEKFENCDFRKENIPLLDEVYVISKATKHESGFKHIATYGVAYDDKGNITWAKKINGYSDVVHIKVEEGLKHSDYIWVLSVDYLEVNVARYFAGHNFKFKITGIFSDFEILVVEENK